MLIVRKRLRDFSAFFYLRCPDGKTELEANLKHENVNLGKLLSGIKLVELNIIFNLNLVDIYQSILSPNFT